MCGITGFLAPARDTSAEALHATVLRMALAIAHRGPDGAGAWVDAEAGVALGHRRLAILDLSVEGHQPMASASGRWWIAFNGEIYNFAEVRQELERDGAIAWRGHSDTEIMLAAIERWGIDGALARFNGMFAFAAWDRAERALWLARDRAGEKPLYYGWHRGVLLFGSELKALRAHPRWQGTHDRGALALFLRHGYIPAPYSAYEGIAKLPPGARVRIDADAAPGMLPAPVAYWDPAAAVRHARATPFAGSAEDAVTALDTLLADAVRMRMVADVPLGAFLSGGIDSSVVVGLMQAQSARPVRTFSIGFHEAGYDEAQHAKAVARHLGTDHTELYVTSEEARDVIPRLPTMYDEPFGDSSQIPTFLVSALARRHVTVALSGDGGDELFGGYQRYFIGRDIWRRVAPFPRTLRRGVARGLTALTPAGWNAAAGAVRPLLPSRLRRPDFGAQVHKVADVIAAADGDAFYRGLVSQDERPDRLVGASEPATWLTGRHALPPLVDLTERMMFLDLVTYLPDDILAKVDRASMAVSLEGRIPLLDHRVIEFAWSLPLAYKVREGQGKWVLRRVLDRYVPRTLLDRPKQGFGVPIDAWLRGPLRDWGETLLDAGRLRDQGLLDVAPVRAAWASHLGGVPAHYWLWNVLMLQAWLDAEPSRVEVA
ncbi:MAG: asparagine synthase (glutamine-hydrolyzing) [Gemmatimonadaceae bacterium]|jgi:asparagine synthase (glutamine-hydrolysing)|nr:asparagine synthase (glutamine-hydrolyzing) [Gemmatimonadaceae bacterium]